MAQAARRDPAADEAIPLDPYAVDRAYRLERAKRRAKVARMRARRLAAVRFFVVLVVLLALSVGFVVVVWRQVQELFGL
jgi:hypothetical protein